MINEEELSLESLKKLKQLEEKLNEENKKENKKKKEENSVNNFMQFKSLEHSLPYQVKKKMKTMKIKNLEGLKKLTVTNKKKYYIKILDHKEVQKRKHKKKYDKKA
ncbi:conserved Plasmodium protein, unknown function [Plasmodium sp. gorilla clade G2]|uniref:conserved Plasmodium protein, unknown function n=1 Tax=Plasmodium sp. gorilla clade G2 TaxID=880535 RepID=UPI000D206AD9|nr:conserved Plasmodium protein, unknown function [Plasmodium sp. gorilla clade G2]SOV11933.1 conserved Plasmodium protein, unknown function [Plasmodium sp. gorilla clade G2]